MKFEIAVDVVIVDKHGKVIKRIRKKCRSYIRQMIDLLQIGLSYTSGTVKDTGGTSRTASYNNPNFNSTAAAANANYGIQVGTGTTTVTISDYQLATQIAHGAGSGQLQYGATSVGSVAIIGTSAQFIVARTFTNSSGASITVNEVGLVSRDGVNLWYYMMERSLITFAIADGASATVTYTIKVTV